MITESQIEVSQSAKKRYTYVTSSSEAVSQVESSDTIETELIGCMVKIRDELVRGITLRFPIKGLDMVVRQAFDNALQESIDNILSIFGSELEQSSPMHSRSRKAHSSVTGHAQNFDFNDMIPSQTKTKGSRKVEPPGNDLKIPGAAPDTKIETEKDENINAKVVKEYQKRIDELMLAVKARDRKILDQKKDIEKLQNSLSLSEKQRDSPFVYTPTPDYEEESQILDQMQSFREFMRRITPILERDPKYRIMFFLKRVRKSDVSKLSEDLCIPLKKLNTLLKELEIMKIIRKEEDAISIMDVQ
ncbi:MAG: hypothetical protein WED07_15545 [Candidatus Freyarchaeum deiterrae]